MAEITLQQIAELMRQELGTLEARMDQKLAAQTDFMRQELAAQEARIVSGLEARMDQQFDALETRMDQKFTAMEKRFDTIDAKLAEHSAGFKELSSMIIDLNVFVEKEMAELKNAGKQEESKNKKKRNTFRGFGSAQGDT